MTSKFLIVGLSLISCSLITGCLYRGEGVFKQIGDSDYKARVNILNVFVAANGRPTYISGTLMLEDKITPVKFTHVLLKKSDDQSIITTTTTDNVGNYTITGLLSEESYLIEIDSPNYYGSKAILVYPNKKNWHEIVAHKK